MALVTLPNGNKVSVTPDAQLNSAGQYQFTNVSPEARDAYISANGSNPTQGVYKQQLAATTDMYNQQAAAQAAKIRQAIATQTQLANNTKQDYTNQMNDAITTLNTERAKIPGQITTLNNTASNTGITNAQKVRNALSQMGLLQSGESASQQLQNDTTVQNNINANNLQGQELDMNYGNQIASAQTELASKIKQINDAISLAQAQGDENALLVLKDAQAKIADATATNAMNYNNWAYTASQDAIKNRMNQQQIDSQNDQRAIDNTYRQNQADLSARQWQSQFDQNNNQFDKNYNLNQQQLAASQAKSNNSTPNVTQQKYAQEQDSKIATADAFDVLNSLANQGKTRSEIFKYIKDNYSTFANGNVDMNALWDMADKAFQWDG